MKALILKDFYSLEKSMKMVAFVLIAYGIFGIVSGGISFMIGITAVMCAVMPISSFSYDDFAKWDTYALSMPISRKQIVMAKYAIALLMTVIGILITLLFGLAAILVNGIADIDASELLGGIAGTAAVCVLMISVILPIIIKFGVEKGRIAMFAVIFTPTVLFIALVKFWPGLIPLGEDLDQILPLAIKLSPIVLLIILAVSYFISLNVYNAKEF